MVAENMTDIEKKSQAEPTAWFAQALAYMRIKHWQEAEQALRQALESDPDYAEAHCNLGYVLEQRGCPDAAEEAYRRSMALAPSLLNAALNLGVMLQSQSRFDEVEAIYQQAIQQHPDQLGPWTNLGILYTAMQRDHEAERCHRQALTLDPDYRKARFNLSYLLLRQGRFEEGWACLEARTMPAQAGFIDAPRWKGEPLSGKTLLLVCEGGHGDALQFCRYAILLQQQWSVRLHIVCPPALERLFAMQSLFEQVWTKASKAKCDYWCPLLSLPGLFDTRIDNIPADTPYLRVDEELAAQWQALLPLDGFRVGLVWKGNPKFENDTDRSLPSLTTLSPLRQFSNVHFICLQQTPASEASEKALGMKGLPEVMVDFADTAAVITGLDLVISVDTAVAHLAGALGKPCWLMLPHHMADWRWMTTRDDSPWYPTLRLFRQEVRGHWVYVAMCIALALQAKLEAKDTRE
ncbi:tetratricopeptide repeat protein [Methylovorus menthalis]|uniref:tetratricopeptide repeat protein n=1 Tax=Methylovorus menthalis TaxID=1002227 RepID=UPI001E3D1B77|nr:tetratricopeptide repeat protein [Methylovorus menthalis]MCB4812235.1 tetratricopeptide repeat protein [Methylovorus menthalis]